MRKALVSIAAFGLTVAAIHSASAADKQLVIVVKGLDNAYFESMHQGCEKWNSTHKTGGYHCMYTGPASTSDEAGEAQLVQDELGKPDVAAVAISPSNAPLIANAIKTSNARNIPVMTVDADLAKGDAALRKTYLGTDNYLMGQKLGEYLKKAQPKGGTVCIIEGNAAADNILRRAQGTIDALSGKKGLKDLDGSGGWKEQSGCPVFTNDDGTKGVQAMTDILTANPNLDAFVIEGGWPLFGAPQPYRELMGPHKDKIASKKFVVASADTIGDEMGILKDGLVNILVGQQPFKMGEMAPDVMIKLVEGKKVSDPVFTGLDVCTKDNADTCISK
jgi:ribose transport system substrate-binding protein